MRIHAIKEQSRVNGPGTRAVVWFQGCQNMGGPGKGCSGCWNPDTHAVDGGEEIEFAVLLLRLLAIENIDGITFSGGEPMQQAGELWSLMLFLKRDRPKLSLGMYTGYSRRELNYGLFGSGKYLEEQAVNRVFWAGIQSKLDFAVMGRYNQLKPVDQPLVTSSNQELALFSDRYTLADFPPQQVEYDISSEGLVSITGFPVSR